MLYPSTILRFILWRAEQRLVRLQNITLRQTFHIPHIRTFGLLLMLTVPGFGGVQTKKSTWLGLGKDHMLDSNNNQSIMSLIFKNTSVFTLCNTLAFCHSYYCTEGVLPEWGGERDSYSVKVRGDWPGCCIWRTGSENWLSKWMHVGQICKGKHSDTAKLNHKPRLWILVSLLMAPRGGLMIQTTPEFPSNATFRVIGSEFKKKTPHTSSTSTTWIKILS